MPRLQRSPPRIPRRHPPRDDIAKMLPGGGSSKHVLNDLEKAPTLKGPAPRDGNTAVEGACLLLRVCGLYDMLVES